MRANNLKTRDRGFTLIEIIVVVAIIGALMVIAAPSVRTLTQGSRSQSALNTIAVGVTAARAYSARDKGAMFIDVAGNFSGTAVLFTPANELRLIENIPGPRSLAPETTPDSNMLENGGGFVGAGELNGFRDIPNRDYVKMPRFSGAVGIVRTDTGTVLLAPPFAIRFTEGGALAIGDDTSGNPNGRIVYYDGNLDNRYDITSRRTAFYDPQDYDPEYGGKGSYDTDAQKYRVPFEAIEAVVGVVAYSKDGLRAAGHTLNAFNPVNAGAGQWILENGEPMFFSRYSGTPFRRYR